MSEYKYTPEGFGLGEGSFLLMCGRLGNLNTAENYLNSQMRRKLPLFCLFCFVGELLVSCWWVLLVVVVENLGKIGGKFFGSYDCSVGKNVSAPPKTSIFSGNLKKSITLSLNT